MNGFIKSILAIFTILIMVSPIVKALKSDINIFAYGDVDLQGGYLTYVNDKIGEYYSEQCENLLISEGVKGTVKIQSENTAGFFIKKVFVNLTDLGIYSEDEHIVIVSKIKESLKNYLLVEEDKVIVNVG